MTGKSREVERAGPEPELVTRWLFWLLHLSSKQRNPTSTWALRLFGVREKFRLNYSGGNGRTIGRPEVNQLIFNYFSDSLIIDS